MDTFSISSPDWAKRAAGLAKVRPQLVVRDAAVVVAERLVEPLRASARAAGASQGMVGNVRVHDGHMSDLVMRDQGHRGDVIVGVDGFSRHAEEAESLEWGSLDERPMAWVRTTAARLHREVSTMWSNEMTRELDRQVLR
jgi:hypothetical protein